MPYINKCHTQNVKLWFISIVRCSILISTRFTIQSVTYRYREFPVPALSGSLWFCQTLSCSLLLSKFAYKALARLGTSFPRSSTLISPECDMICITYDMWYDMYHIWYVIYMWLHGALCHCTIDMWHTPICDICDCSDNVQCVICDRSVDKRSPQCVMQPVN